MTPLLQGYARDNVKLRVIQGSQEEQHLFQVHGLRWREEPDDPGSPLVNAQTIGISEAFNAEMPGFDCKATDTPCRGDYLYGGTTMDDLWNGMWGIMRVHGTQHPACASCRTTRPAGHDAAAPGAAVPPGSAARAPARRALPDDGAGAGLRRRRHQQGRRLQRVRRPRPQGPDVRPGRGRGGRGGGHARSPSRWSSAPTPGDCVKVTPAQRGCPAAYGNNVNGVDGDPALVLEPTAGTKMGTRVSLHPQLVRSRRAPLRRRGGRLQPRLHRRHRRRPSPTSGSPTPSSGRPTCSTTATCAVTATTAWPARWSSSPSTPPTTTRRPARRCAAASIADIRVPGQEDFRETTLVYQDGMDLRPRHGRPGAGQAAGDFGPDGSRARGPSPDGGDVHAGGHEDAGEKGVNYTNAPLHRRLGAAPGSLPSRHQRRRGRASSPPPARRPADADRPRPTPATSCASGCSGANRPRQMGFQLDGASWRQEPYDTESRPRRRAGRHRHRQGRQRPRAADRRAGDHLWTSPTTYGLPDGIWGMARVYP